MPLRIVVRFSTKMDVEINDAIAFPIHLAPDKFSVGV